MKNYTIENIKKESFVIFSFYQPVYINLEKFQNLLGLNCEILLRYADLLVYITVNEEIFQKECLTVDEFQEKVVCALNQYAYEENIENEKKEIKIEKELEDFEKNGFKYCSLIQEDFSKQKHLHELQEYAKYMLKQVESWRKVGDKDMMVCKYCDAKDVTEILYYLTIGDIKKAYNKAYLLDTIVREGIPDTAWDLIS